MKRSKKHDIEDFILAGLYSADKEGAIYSHRDGKKKKLILSRKPNGYLKFNAYGFGVSKTFHAHRFVWVFFNGFIPGNRQVHHRDFDRQNNSISNLELATPKQNSRASSRMGRFSISKNVGSKNSKAKLCETKVVEIRKLLQDGISVSKIAIEYCVGTTAIYDVKHGRRWKHI